MAAKRRHGAANDDRLTVWFLARNSNVIVSPTCAVMFEGLYASAPLSPTRTLWSVGDADVDATAEVDVDVTAAEVDAREVEDAVAFPVALDPVAFAAA